MMKQTEKNLQIDLFIFVALFVTALSGIFLWLGNPLKGLINLGSLFGFWKSIHICSGVIGLTGIVMHITSHWKWLKAMRGRLIKELPKIIRANRILNRVMWIAFITTTLFGVIALGCTLFGKTNILNISNRLHVGSGFFWLTLAIVHLVFHRKWIFLTLRRLEFFQKTRLNSR